MLQLSWEGLQEGKSVLQGVEAVGDQILRAEVGVGCRIWGFGFWASVTRYFEQR
jgi:hypothetical protein